MTSEGYTEAFVWFWLPGETSPVVAGRLHAVDGELMFNYGRSYLVRTNAIPIYAPELPLESGTLPLLNGLKMPSCLRDASPDAWGRRVIINRQLGAKRHDIDTDQLDEMTYLLESGSDRAGAIDFQRSATTYVPRTAASTLNELLGAVERVEQGVLLSDELDQALLHGSSIGGARPKAMIESNSRKFVAKFSSQQDVYSVVKGEYVAMKLAAEAGLNVAPVQIEHIAGKDILLIERFDRERAGQGWIRKAFVSALTLLELDEMMARYASYENLGTIVRHRFDKPKATLRELFARLVFNILCGNTDDHARNHAAFWDGETLKLTPAYDVCPQMRSGGEASQSMLIVGNESLSQMSVCLKAAPNFLLSVKEAKEIIAHQVRVILDRWTSLCDEAGMNEVDRSLMWRRQFLNPFAFDGAPSDIADLVPDED